MASARPKVFDFHRGLQTKSLEDGQPLPEFQTFANVRVDKGAAKVRSGMSRVLNASSLNGASDFEASSSQYYGASVDARPWTLGLNWTVEALVNLETITSGTLLYVGTTTPAIIIDLSSSKWRVRVYDSAAALTTVTTTADASSSDTSIQIKRDGSALTFTVDNATQTTGTMSATLACRAPVGSIRIGADNTPGTYLDGVVDYVRAFGVTRSDHNDRLVRFPDPRADYVLADYDMNVTANGIIKDRSRFGNALLAPAGQVPADASALCHQSSMVQGISYYVGADGKKYALVVAGGQAYHVVL